MPEAVFVAEADRDTIYDNVAHVLQTAPEGFRYTLLITGGSEASPSGKAAYEFAGSLVDRGVVPQDILIGASTDKADHLHLSFLVFEGELGDDSEPWSAGIMTAVPPMAATKATPAAEPSPQEPPSVEQAPADQPLPDQPAGAPEP